jgi:hypothetical protein
MRSCHSYVPDRARVAELACASGRVSPCPYCPRFARGSGAMLPLGCRRIRQKASRRAGGLRQGIGGARRKNGCDAKSDRQCSARAQGLSTAGSQAHEAARGRPLGRTSDLSVRRLRATARCPVYTPWLPPGLPGGGITGMGMAGAMPASNTTASRANRRFSFSRRTPFLSPHSFANALSRPEFHPPPILAQQRVNAADRLLAQPAIGLATRPSLP